MPKRLLEKLSPRAILIGSVSYLVIFLFTWLTYSGELYWAIYNRLLSMTFFPPYWLSCIVFCTVFFCVFVLPVFILPGYLTSLSANDHKFANAIGVAVLIGLFVSVRFPFLDFGLRLSSAQFVLIYIGTIASDFSGVLLGAWLQTVVHKRWKMRSAA